MLSRTFKILKISKKKLKMSNFFFFSEQFPPNQIFQKNVTYMLEGNV